MTEKITIKTIQARTGVPVTGEFIIETLGVQPVDKEKRSVFWSEAQYPEIVDKLCVHLQKAKASTVIAAKQPPKPKKEESTAAPAAGGFNFGGTAAPAPAPTQAPAPAVGGFNFGGEAPAPAPATGGFNFG